MKESLTKETLEAFQNDFRANTLHTVAKNAVTVNGLLKSSRNSEAARSTRHELSCHRIILYSTTNLRKQIIS